MAIILDARRMDEKMPAHGYLKEMLQFPDYYGNNLDALYDCLTELGPTEVCFENSEAAGEYFKRIYHVFLDAAESNPQLVILDDDPSVADWTEE